MKRTYFYLLALVLFVFYLSHVLPEIGNKHYHTHSETKPSASKRKLKHNFSILAHKEAKTIGNFRVVDF